MSFKSRLIRLDNWKVCHRPSIAIVYSLALCVCEHIVNVSAAVAWLCMCVFIELELNFMHHSSGHSLPGNFLVTSSSLGWELTSSAMDLDSKYQGSSVPQIPRARILSMC